MKLLKMSRNLEDETLTLNFIFYQQDKYPALIKQGRDTGVKTN